MLNKIYYVLIILVLFVSCEKKEATILDSNQIDNTAKLAVKDSDLFKDKPIDIVLNDIDKISKRKNIKINKFEKLIFENNTYYHSDILNNQKAKYFANVEGINVSNLSLKISNLDANKKEDIENLFSILMEASDMRISEKESKQIYLELLKQFDQSQPALLVYKNKLSYGLSLSDQGELVFFIK